MLYKLLILLGVLLLMSFAWLIYRRYNKKGTCISFKETFKKTGLPIITLYNDCCALNFLVDTGSDVNCINKDKLKYLHYTETNKSGNMVNSSGVNKSDVIMMPINDKHDMATVEFYVLDLSIQFDTIAVYDGVKIDGILGSKFCKDAGLIINYNDYKIYS